MKVASPVPRFTSRLVARTPATISFNSELIPQNQSAPSTPYFGSRKKTSPWYRIGLPIMGVVGISGIFGVPKLQDANYVRSHSHFEQAKASREMAIPVRTFETLQENMANVPGEAREISVYAQEMILKESFRKFFRNTLTQIAYESRENTDLSNALHTGAGYLEKIDLDTSRMNMAFEPLTPDEIDYTLELARKAKAGPAGIANNETLFSDWADNVLANHVPAPLVATAKAEARQFFENQELYERQRELLGLAMIASIVAFSVFLGGVASMGVIAFLDKQASETASQEKTV